MRSVAAAHAGLAASGGLLSAVVAVPTIYLAVLTAAGVRAPGRPRSSGRRRTRFVIFVPAHDEERGIAATLRSLNFLDYPNDRYAVHVVADNCTDATADV